MSKKRGGRVPRPASGGQWELRFLSKRASDDWDKLCQTHGKNAARAYDHMQSDPRARTDRNHPLRDALRERELDGKRLERWQYEVTSGARIWFLIDDARRIVWFEAVHLGHPKATD